MTSKLQERLKVTLQLNGWSSYEKSHHLAQIILEKRPKKIVEIGVFGGRSAIAMAMACQEIGHGSVTGIDPWTKSAALEGGTTKENDEWWAALDIDQVYRTCISTIKTVGVEDYLQILKMHDAEALGLFDDGSIDMLHVDSNHSEVVSVRTVRDWTPKVSAGGIVVMDDSNWATTQRAVELLRDGLGTQWLSTHDMAGPLDTEGKPTCAGQYMLFEKL